MDARRDLFRDKNVYALDKTEALFVRALRENVRHHAERGGFYAEYLKREGFAAEDIRGIEDVPRIPTLHAAFFKRNEVFTVAREDAAIYATSSGTQGQKTQTVIDEDTLKTGTRMVVSCFRHHGLISAMPARYVMLGYEPHESNDMGAVKTAMGVTRFAPAISRTFMLRHTAGGYAVDRFGFVEALKKAGRWGTPVRFVGFPAYMALALKTLEELGLRFRLARGSRVLLGGGWKAFAGEAVGKDELYARAEDRLGIPPESCRDFYSAVEHSVPYAECRRHHMHVPIFSRVYVRDVSTLQPLPFGQPGLLSFVTPLSLAQPLVSVTMADLAVLRDGRECGCGIASPFFEVIGRAGMPAARNCAVSAAEMMGGGA